MYIISVIPVTKIPFPSSQILSYYSSRRAKKYSLVSIPLAKRNILGLVIGSRSLEKQKISIKKAGYQLKHIGPAINPEPVVTPHQLKLAKWLSEYYYFPIGGIFKTLFPEKLFTKPTTNILAPDTRQLSSANNQVVRAKLLPKLVWDKNRWNTYEQAIKKQLRARKQVLFLVPEINQIRDAEKRLARITKKITVLHSSLKKSEYWKNWESIGLQSSGIVIGTRMALFAPFVNLGMVILDEEDNPHYKSWDMHPRYHARDVALTLAEFSGADIILGSSLPSIESYHQTIKAKYKLIHPYPKPYPSTSSGSRAASRDTLKPSIVDMREESKGGNYSIFSKELQEALTNILKLGRKAILFINRRGFATFILCRDCGHVITCEHCEAPLVLHQKSEIRNPKSETNMLLCHHCGKTAQQPKLCPNCKSWKIKFFGAGTQKITEEIKKLFPDASHLQIDSDTAKTEKAQNEIFSSFSREKISILIGTQLLFKKALLSPVSLFGIVSMESILNMPDFRSGERALRLITLANELAQKNLIIQTYNPGHYVFTHLNDVKAFYGEELRARRAFGWPPFSQIIKLSFSHHNPEKASNEAEILKEKLNIQVQTIAKRYKRIAKNLEVLGPVPAFIPRVRGKNIFHIIIKSKAKNLDLRNELLRIVPSHWSIDVDPESIL